MNGKRSVQAKSGVSRYSALAITVIAGTILSVMVYSLASNWEQQRIEASFQREAKEHVEILKREIGFDLQMLLSLKALYDSSESVERSEFSTFATPLLSLHSSVQALAWVPRVPHSQRNRYEMDAREDNPSVNSIREREVQGKMRDALDRTEYFPVCFVEPYKGNEIALGFDLASDPVRRKALDEARDRGTMVATGRLTLVQDTDERYGALVFAPVYRKGSPLYSVPERRESLQGFVIGVFRIGDMVEKSLSHFPSESIDLALYDDSTQEHESVLFYRSSRSKSPSNHPGTLDRVNSDYGFEHAEELLFADRAWRIVMRPTPTYVSYRKTAQPWEILGAGLFLTAVLAGYFIVQKRNEATLLESEEKYRQLFAMESDAILLVDKASDQIFEVNPAGSALYGYSREELLHHMKMTDLLAESDSPGEIMTEQDQCTLMLSHRRKNGIVFPVEITKSSFVWKGCEVYVAAIRDVTERRRAEEALQASWQLYAKAERVGHLGHWNSNFLNDGNSWSAGMYHIFGVDPQRFQITLESFLQLVHPEDREYVRREIADVPPRNNTLDFEYRIIRPDGDERIVHATGEIRYSNDGRALGSFGIARDITTQKRTESLFKEGEARYRSLFTNNHAVMLLVDPETGAIVDANPAACSFYGYSYDEILGLAAHDINILTEEQVKAEMEHARAERRSRFYFTHRLADGTKRDVEVYSGPILVSGKELLYSIVIDITERKRAENELRQANDYLENVFQNSPDGIGIVDKNGKFIKWNRMAAEQFGYSSEELKGRSTFDLYADKGELTKMLENLRRNGAVRRYAVDMKKKDGATATFEFSISLLKDSEGRTLGSVCVARDLSDIKKALTAVEASNERLQREIAERKAVEETLRESERRFREVLENINLLAVSLDLEGRLTFCNDFLLNATGWAEKELLGRDWFKLLFETEPGRVKRRAYLDGILRGEVEPHNEEEIITCLGKSCLISWDNTLLRDPRGTVIGVTKIGRDVGLRRKIEKELREASAEMELLIASIPSILIEISDENRIIRWNSASEKSFGIAPREVMGQPLHECAIPWDWKKISEGLSMCRGQRTSVRLDDVHFVRPDGKDGLLGMVVSPIGGEREDQMGLIVLGADVTEHRLLERQLAQAQKLESIGQLAAGIAHEINTPTQYVSDNIRFLQDAFEDFAQLLDRYAGMPAALQAGRPLVELMQEMNAAAEETDLEYLREEIPRAIQQSLEGVTRVSKIVEAMKEFSHPGTSEKTPLNINQAINSTITVARNEWKYVADMVVDVDDTLPLVLCLPGEFNQVILNLIVNAAHSIAEALAGGTGKKGTITVATRNQGDNAEIRITDTGTGIPEEIRSRIFDPFFTTKDVGKGTGQGLAIAHSVIVDKHGGAIHFETAMGRGTSFVISLPIAAPQVLKGSEG